MIIKFKRSRLRSIIDSLDHGRYITCPREGEEWEDMELLAVAGACMSELMFRRETELMETTDEVLRTDRHLPFERLSSRLSVALDYAICVTSTIRSCHMWPGDKTYKTEVYYNGSVFKLMKAPKDGPTDKPPAPEGATVDNAVTRQAA
ncbi:MAG: hypothetical protein MI923_09295 [Phycisphaerales bacterium]|nr:hypothetical protein [Phycisphaerales bacterium]